MFCSKCGANIADGSPFCPACGGAQGAPQKAGFQPIQVGGVSLSLYKLLMLGAIVLMIIGCMVPGLSVGSADVAFIDNYPGINGSLILVAAVAGLALVVNGKDKQAYLPMIVALTYSFYYLFWSFAKSGPDLHVGLFLVLVGALAAAILPFTPVAKEDK